MKEGAEAFANTVTQVEALIADTSLGGTKRFKHLRTVYDPTDLLDIKSPSRKFILMPTGQRSLVGFLGQEGQMTSVLQSLDLHVSFLQPKDAKSLYQIIMEDVDSIGRQLMKTANFAPDITGLESRTVEGYTLSLDDQSGGTCLLTIPVRLRYTPTY